jgi:hypothetical protein
MTRLLPGERALAYRMMRYALAHRGVTVDPETEKHTLPMPGRAVIASVYDLLARLACAIFGAARFGFGAICAANPTAWVLSALALTRRVPGSVYGDRPAIRHGRGG